ncbi:MAG: hypothetical protein JWN72_47 [Thermoleophilia bacterium]|nr:hypothetical protein [Thermoleophilia bacterium]
MALRNGVLMLGPTSWAATIRTRGGGLETAAGRRPTVGETLSAKVPLLRGPVRLLNMLLVLPRLRRALPDSRLSLESPDVLGVTAAGAVLVRTARMGFGPGAASEAVATLGSLASTFATMRIGDIAQYHGAEHKAIGGYEQGIAAREATREHPRCGTQLAIPMVVFSAIATHTLFAVLPRHTRRSAPLLGQLLGVAAATELFRAAHRGRGGAIARASQRLGITLQTHATTQEPTDAQLEVAEAALERVLAVERRTHA